MSPRYGRWMIALGLGIAVCIGIDQYHIHHPYIEIAPPVSHTGMNQYVPWEADDKLSPGLLNDPATPVDVLCDHHDHPTKERRRVYASEKKDVMAEYHISFDGMNEDQRKAFRKTFELDHRVPVELDGSNDPANLSPQSYLGDKNAHMKDDLENKMFAMVCKTHTISLHDAQQVFFGDWWVGYEKYVAGSQ
jgi:hypothetical protein